MFIIKKKDQIIKFKDPIKSGLFELLERNNNLQDIELKTDNERKTKDLKDLHSMILEWDKIMQSGNIDVVKI